MAILVGINAYENGISPLKTPKNDAMRLAQVLQRSYNYDIKQLVDTQATLNELNSLLENLKEGKLTLADNRIVKIASYDQVLFHFAGHGIALDGLDSKEGPTGYLIPQDAHKGDKNTFLPMQQLHDVLINLKSRHLLVILDCCFAGAFRFSRNLVPYQKLYWERYDRYMKGKAQQTLFSAAHDEKALDILTRLDEPEQDSIEKNSPFAQVLLKALRGDGDIIPDGAITASELHLYLENELAKITDRQTPGLSQLKYHDKGEYIFLVPGFQPDKLEQAPPLSENTNPYRGLKPYEPKHSKLFFGRERVLKELVEQVSDTSKLPLTVIVGLSGSGKSSLVKAGLIPHLPQDKWKILAPVQPGKSPFKSVAEGVLLTLQKTATSDQINVLSQKLQQTPQTLIEVVSANNNKPSAKLLLVIDQFEELVTLCPPFEKRQFLGWLNRLLRENSQQLHVAITVRSEFEPEFSGELLEQSQWMAARFVVPPLTQDELREVIEKPAAEQVLFFEPPNLVDQLINEVAQMPGSLPLLSFTLSELYLKCWERWKQGETNRTLTREDYQQLGGVMGSLTNRATEIYESLVKLDLAYEQTIRHVMLRMVAVGGELARRRVPSVELEYPEPENQRVKEVIHRFLEARLLVTGTNAESQPYVEPAHDALVLGWQKLLAWRQDKKEQENLILQRRLTPAALEWENKQQPRFLWNADPRLDLLKQVLNSADNWFNQVEVEFVQNSVKQKRKNIFARWSLVTSALVVLSSVSIVAIHNAINAWNNSLNTSSELSKVLFASDRQLEAMEEIVKAAEMLKKNKFFAREDTNIRVVTTLMQLVYQTRERNRLEGHEENVTSVSFSPDGKTIASTSLDKTIRLWRRDGTSFQKLPEHEDEVLSVCFSRDGQTLISASNNNIIKWQRQPDGTFKFLKSIRDNDGIAAISLSPNGKTIATASKKYTVKLWLDGKPPTTLQKHGGQVGDLSFSPNGQTIASASEDKTIKLWNLKNGKLSQPIEDNNPFFGVRFVDNNTIASASADKTVKLWNLKGKLIKTFAEHSDKVFYIDVSPNGKTIASISQDHTVRLWWREYNKPVQVIKASDERVDRVGFSPDSKMIALAQGKIIKLWNLERVNAPITLPGSRVSFSSNNQMIVTGDQDGSIKLWERNGKWRWNLPYAHSGSVLQVSFSPNGKVIASASIDGTVKLWNLDKTPIAMIRHKDSVLGVSFSPDSKIIASASADHTVKLSRLDGTLIRTLEGHKDDVTSVSFSPDGKTIASSSTDNTVKLWRLDGTLKKNLEEHKSNVLSVSFSPNGKMMASSSSDNNVIVWNVINGTHKKLDHNDDGRILKVNFSPNSQTLVSASSDGIIRFWSIDGGPPLQTLKSFNDDNPIFDVSFSPDRKTIASAGFSGEVILRNLDLDDLLRLSCSWLNDYINNKYHVNDRNICKDKYSNPK